VNKIAVSQLRTILFNLFLIASLFLIIASFGGIRAMLHPELEYFIMRAYYQKEIKIYAHTDFRGDETYINIYVRGLFWDKLLKKIYLDKNIGNYKSCLCDILSVEWIDQNSFYLLIGHNKEKFLIKID